MMLQTALRARLPMIVVRTSDPLNEVAMLEHYATQNILSSPLIKLGVPVLPPDSTTVMFGTEGLNLQAVFKAAAEKNAVLIIVNPEEVPSMAFDAGVVHMPESMLKNFVEQYGPEDGDNYELEAALRGLTFKEVGAGRGRARPFAPAAHEPVTGPARQREASCQSRLVSAQMLTYPHDSFHVMDFRRVGRDTRGSDEVSCQPVDFID